MPASPATPKLNRRAVVAVSGVRIGAVLSSDAQALDVANPSTAAANPRLKMNFFIFFYLSMVFESLTQHSLISCNPFNSGFRARIGQVRQILS